MYQTENYYMYEILEDYQTAVDSKEQEEIFAAFCALIWNSPNERIHSEKFFTFHVPARLAATETGQIFAEYSSLSCPVCTSVTKETDFASLIRQKANNIYTNLFDKEVCTKKDYLDCLRLPGKLYHQWAKSLSGKHSDWIMTPKELSRTLEEAMEHASSLRETYRRQKMDASWEEYCQITEGFFRRLFQNYRPLDDYCSRKQPENLLPDLHTETWHEDHFCISYFCNGLNGYFKNYQKKYYGLSNASSQRNVQYSRCPCGNLFRQNKQHNRRLCDTCREQARLRKYQRYNQKRKQNSLCEIPPQTSEHPALPPS